MEQMKYQKLEYAVEELGDIAEDVRTLYVAAREAGDRAERRNIIHRLYKLPFKPSIAFIADVVNETRAVILATIQDQGWSR
jgi:hypothetical protein